MVLKGLLDYIITSKTTTTSCFSLVATSFHHMTSTTTIGIKILFLLAFILLVVGVDIGAFLGLLVDLISFNFN
jgi:hypothetical protein